ncbi:hypothetical protein FJ364_01265 [Candidatus Dependentiae bacterium]|nr:hypothetical protein [Candidatus Dependentiae bacterium]
METEIRCGKCGYILEFNESMIIFIKNNLDSIADAVKKGTEAVIKLTGFQNPVVNFLMTTYGYFYPTRGVIDVSLASIANSAQFACPGCKESGPWSAYSRFYKPIETHLLQLLDLKGRLHKLMGETLDQLANVEEQLLKTNIETTSVTDLNIEHKAHWERVVDLNSRLDDMERSRIDLLQQLNIKEEFKSQWNPQDFYTILSKPSTTGSIVIATKFRKELIEVLRLFTKAENDFSVITKLTATDNAEKLAMEDAYRKTSNESSFCKIYLMVIKKQLLMLEDSQKYFTEKPICIEASHSTAP